jgi:methionyl aminopeptidase
MTEKDYSGTVTGKIGKNARADNNSSKQLLDLNNKTKKEKTLEEKQDFQELTQEDIENYKKAGQIAKQVKEYAKTIIKKDVFLSEIANKIEDKILELGGEVAFPVNLSVDDVAAHYTPSLRDEKKALGLLKADIGIHVNGCIADMALTFDLTPEKKYTSLVEASQEALKAAIKQVQETKEKTTLSQIGKIISQTITNAGCTVIANLSGHGLGKYDIHSGINIPNYDNKSTTELGEGAFAIEPFATLKNGAGAIYDGAGSNIYRVVRSGQVRDASSREIITWILENKQMLPFSSRELERKFGTKALIAISNLKRAGVIDEFSQLVEKNHQVVSQAETSFIIHNGKVEVLVE